MSDADPKLMTIFAEALERTDPTDRAAYLDTACEGKPSLRRRVEALLAAHDGAGQFLEGDPTGISEATSAEAPKTTAASGAETRLPSEPVTAADRADSTTAGKPTDRRGGFLARQVIAGRYTLLEVLGEGGMGTVYRAEQTQPVKRQVALKLIKIGMDSRTVLARFDAERQALALMDHPNIARVYDGGTTEAGQPFFVMELVEGEPITEYCDRQRLSVRARLELFVSVCKAVQHAHQKGIIHRDLKPSNVMVTEVDGRATPKVIDFGVAKATAFKLTDQSLADTGAIVGTPTYMSPEQADPASMDIDTRTDVYALGVILYELLAGSPPLDARQFKKGAILEMLRMVREVDPPRPSTKVSTADTLPSIAANRDLDPAQLKRTLQGDLDWIVMMALEKDRTRRYETANGFAADILRHLGHEPVVAAPPSRTYRLRKFVRKHRVAVLAASLVILALEAGMAGTTWALIEARRAQFRAEVGEQLSKDRLVEVYAEKKKAEDEKTIAQTVRSFLKNTLLAQTDTRTQANDLLKAGESSSGATLNPTIRELLDRAAKKLAPDRIEASLPKQPLIQAEILQTIGTTYRNIGEPQLAIEFLKRSEALRRQHLGAEHPDTLNSMSILAMAYCDVGKLDLALPLFEQTLKVRKVMLGPDHPDTFRAMGHVATAYVDAGKLDLALPLFEETLKFQKAMLGPEHPDTLMSMSNLAVAYNRAGKFDLALPLDQETYMLKQAKLGPDHPDTLMSMNNLAATCWSANKLEKSIPLFEESLRKMDSKLGRDHPNTLLIAANLGVNYRDAGRLKEAIPLLEEVYRGVPKHPNLRWAGEALQDAYAKAGEHAKAAKLFQERLAEARTNLPKNSPQLAQELASLGLSWLQAKAFAEAEPLLRESLPIREQKEPNYWKTFDTRSMLGEALLGQKRYADAEPLLLAGYEGLKQRQNTIPPQNKVRLQAALDRLIELSTATNKPDEVKKWQAERANYPPNSAPGKK